MDKDRTARATPCPAVLGALAATCVLLVAPAVGRAALINEQFISDGAADGMPHAVELVGLDQLSASAVDLIVIDATDRQYGEVRRVITVPADDPLLMVSEQAWPSELWGMSEEYLGESRTTLAALDEGESLGFTTAWTVLLYDRTTNVRESNNESLFSDFQQAALGDAELLDAVTVVLEGVEADPEAEEPVFDLAPGSAVVRPLGEDGKPADELLAGAVTERGTLAGLGPTLEHAVELTPGGVNVVVTPTPEPTTAALLLAGLAAVLTGRGAGRRRCSAGSGRL